jgi:hypothetical protein
MDINEGDFNFSINTDWITESGLVPFSKTKEHYLYEREQGQSQPIILINHNDIDPNIRGKNVPIFKDGYVNGKWVIAKQRVLDILNAIVQDTTLPPIEVIELVDNQYRYKLHHGCHRLHLSILAGFKTIPAIVIDWL